MTNESMQMPDEGKFSKVAFSWLCGSFAWLAVAGVLGVVESLPAVLSLAGIHDSGGRAGFLTLARSGAFDYGWAGMATIALLLYCIRPHAGRWERLMHSLAWCWSACIAAGVISVLAGWGTGNATMPFDRWILLPLTAIAWGIHFVVWSDAGERGWRVRIPALTSFFIICLAFLVMCMGEWQGVDEIVMMACVRSSLIGAAVTIALTGLWRSTLVWNEKMIIPVSVLLTLLPLLSSLVGIRELQGMPVPWQWMQAGTWTSWILAGILVFIGILGIYRIIDRRRVILPTVRFWLGASFVMMMVWGGVEIGFSGGKIFGSDSAGEWYIVELLLFCSLGLLLRAAWHLCLHGKVSWGDYAWGTGCLFLWITWALHGYASHVSQGVDPRMMRQVMCEGIAFASVFALIAWIFLFLSAAISWMSCMRGEIGELTDQSSEDGSKYFFQSRGWIGLALLALASASLIWISLGRNTESFVKRPGASREGSLIYAREGCGVCHTQMVRRTPSRNQLQREIDNSGISGASIRETEPEDYSPLMKEGVAHAGWVALGPDLSHLRTRLEKKLSYEDASGNDRMIARPEEWLLLHMYNPREPMLKTPWSSCPALTHLFERRPIPRTGFSDDALPVQVSSGYEIVPTSEAKALLSYLMTLQRGAVNRTDGSQATSEDLEKRGWNPPGAVIPVPDLSAQEKIRKKREFLRGQEIYLAKCSICHGADGKGDSLNYPPLKDSEWISDKDGHILVDIIKNGLRGPIRVKGRDWNSIMLPPGVGSADDLAPLMNYLRSVMSSKPLAPVSREQTLQWWSTPIED